jgi:hypothetical protein
MKRFLAAFAVCALLASLSSQALAGGSSRATIKVTNVNPGTDTANVLMVVIDQPVSVFTDANVFARVGGKYLFSGQSAKFNVSAGNHGVVVAYIQAPFLVGPTAPAKYLSVGKNKTANVFVSGDNANPPTVSN